MRTVVLRFLLKGGHTIDVVMGEGEAKELVSAWATGRMTARKSGWDSVLNRAWAIEPTEIQGMLSLDYQQIVTAQQQAQQGPTQQRYPGLPFSSGNN